MFYSENIDIKMYTDLMEQIKKVNTDWLRLRKSSQYRIGLIINEVTGDIKYLRLSALSKSVKRWTRGAKSRQIQSHKGIVCEKTNKTNYFSSDRIAIYTAVFGDYDCVPEPYCTPDNCDFYIFTDQKHEDESSIWKKKSIPNEIRKFSNAEKNRYLKMHPDRVFADYKYSVYIDGNVQIITDLTEYINMLGTIGIGIHLHDSRSCVFDELEVIRRTRRESSENIKRHINYLKETGMPGNYGLLQCNVIIREHNNPVCLDIMDHWWQEYMMYTKRDQVSLPHVLYLHGIEVNEIGILGSSVYSNPSFRVVNHI